MESTLLEKCNGNTENAEIVTWNGPEDPERPMNWPSTRKWLIVVVTTLMTFMVSFGSSVFSATIEVTRREFDTTANVMLLGISLYVLGLALGPLIFGPASELYGRNAPLWLGYSGFVLFQAPLGVAKDVHTVLICRFFAGLFGSAPLAVSGGRYADMMGPVERGISTATISVAVYCGPALGPVIGNVIVAHVDWRWTAWVTLIFGAFFGMSGFVFIPETAESTILRRRAQQLRLETSNWALHAKSEERPTNLVYFVEKYLTKPVRMLIAEPILAIFTCYMSMVYGILYLTLTLYPYAFRVSRGWGAIDASHPFLYIAVGVLIACSIIGGHSVWHGRSLKAGKTLAPEQRLPPTILGSLVLPLGLFLFAWTSDRETSWHPQVFSGIFIGCGIVLVFACSLLYLIEVYLEDANSALAINTFMRGLTAAAFPLFSSSVFEAMGVKWTGSFLGFICIALAPFPIIMMRWGPKVRARSRYAK